MPTQSAKQQDDETRIHARKKKASTAKLHVSPEIAELVKIYCIITKKNMTTFTTHVLEQELSGFKQRLAQLKQVGGLRQRT